MTVQEQIDWLLALGERLDHWTSPGDAEDTLGGKSALWNEAAKKYLPAPARVADVLLFRWMKIKDFGTQKPVAFLLNPVQMDFSKRRTGRDIITKAGRVGFTIDEMILALLHTCTHQGYTAVLMSLDRESAEDFFTQVRFAFDHMMPQKMGEEFRKGALRTERKNVREIFLPELNSHFFIDTAGNFAPAQGSSIQYLIADEMARWKSGDPKQVIGTLLSHMTGANTRATLMSRPFGQAGEFYERYWAARRGESRFEAHFYSWTWNVSNVATVPPDFTRTDEEEQLCAKYRMWRADPDRRDCALPLELSDDKLAWRREAKKDLTDLFGQEFAEDESACFLGSGNCPFDAIAIDKVQNDLTPILERTGGKGESENGLLRWENPDPNDWYVLFIDPAGTLGTSRVAMQLFSGTRGTQAAEWVGRGDADTCAMEAFDLALRFERVFIAIELNLGATSATMMAKMVEKGLRGTGYMAGGELRPWPRLYRSQNSGGHWIAGWNTDPKNRPLMLSTLGEIWREHPERFHSKRLANEIKTSVRNGDRIEQGQGCTNDLVMAAAGALAVIPLVRIAPRQIMATTLEVAVGKLPGSRVTDTSEIGWTKIP